MKKKLILLAVTFSSVLIFSESLEKLNTNVYDWNQLEVEQVKSGETRKIFEGHTQALRYFEVYATTLNAGAESCDSVIDSDTEELIIVKEGNVLHSMNGEETRLGPGSVILTCPEDGYRISNGGDTPITYYRLRWKTGAPADPDRLAESGGSQVYDWNKIKYRENKKGGVRSILRRPTGLLSELEMHVTTLNENITSHEEHIHDNEEIILVIKGEVEESIEGVPHRAGPGTLMLLVDGVSHGIKNVGEGQCEYFAFKWLP